MVKDQMLSHRLLLSMFLYDSNTGIFTRAVSQGKELIGSRAGTNNAGGYRQIAIDQKFYYEHRLAWFYVHGEWPNGEIDHINGVRDDNRLANLRVVTRTENLRNRGMSSHNTSGITGVSWNKERQQWVARINVNKRALHLGWYLSFNEAVKARQEAEERYGFTIRKGRT